MIAKSVVTQINTSTYTAIDIPFSDFYRPVSYFTDDDTSFVEAVTSAGEGEATIPEKTKVNVRAFVEKGSGATEKNGRLLWAKATAGTPNLVVKIGLPEK